jgi:hypothetical protein
MAPAAGLLSKWRNDGLGQYLLDVLCQVIVDFPVTWNWLLLARTRVEVNVVVGAGPRKNTAVLLDVSDEINMFHIAIGLMECSSGTSSMAISKYASLKFASNSSTVSP